MELNSAYKPLYASDNPIKVVYGGAGSGKSYSTAQYLLYRCLSEPNSKFLCIRKVFATLKDSVYALLVDILEHNYSAELFSAKKSPLSIEFNNGSCILFKGLDDREKLKSIAGIRSIWVEEASEINEDDYEQLRLRLRDKQTTRQEIILTFNPVSKSNWTYKRWFDGLNKDGAMVLKTTYKDNVKFLAKKYVEYLESLVNINVNYARIYRDGEFGVFEGLVFPAPLKWADKGVIESVERWYGVDFGFNDPTAVVELNKLNDGRIIVKELLYDKGLTVPDLIKKLKDIGVKGRLYCDSARPDAILEMRRSGLDAVKSNKSIVDGIDTMQSMWSNLYFEGKNIITEIENYEYLKNKDGELLDVPVDKDNHLIDATRYALHTKYGANTYNVAAIHVVKNKLFSV